MRVLHVSHQYPPAIGGSEKYIADLSEELARRGHQVDVFTTRSTDFHTWTNVLPRFEQRNNVNVYRFTSLYRRGSVWRILHFGLRHYWQNRSRLYEPLIFLGGGPIAPAMFWQILRRAPRYDLVHLNCLVYSHVTYGYWAARLRHVPIVVTPHVHPEQEVTYNIGFQRTVLVGSDHLLADTPAEKTFLEQLDLQLAPQRISVVGVGMQSADFPQTDTAVARRQLGLPENAFILLFLSRKSRYKGLEHLLQAFAHLQPEHPNLCLVAAGPETAESQTLWPRYQQLNNLRILDKVSEVEKLALLQACDVFALPSVGEAFGIMYLEAWMMGKPVIGADITAVRSVITAGEDGLLAKPDDAADLARCIRFMQEHPVERKAMGQRGREKVLAHYTISRTTDRLEAVYRQVLAERGSTNG